MREYLLNKKERARRNTGLNSKYINSVFCPSFCGSHQWDGGFLFVKNYFLKGFSYFSSHFEKAASS